MEDAEAMAIEKQVVAPVSILRVLPFDARIRDVVYDYIPYVKSVEAPIIDSWPLQRLRYVMQLQLAHFVYPTATHTRFSHSLGVMHIAHRFMNQILSRIESQSQSLPREATKLLINHPREVLLATRIAGLLHDIGHGPFSHAFDKYVLHNEVYGYRIWNHEMLGYIIYKYYLRDYIAKKLASNTIGIDYEVVLELLDEAMKPPRGLRRYTNLVEKGVLEESDFYEPDPDLQAHRLVRMVVRDFLYPADILDYLVRDSYYTNQPIGAINIDWLILQTYIISHEGVLQIALSEKAIDDLVRMLNARRFMYKRVYLHHVNQAFSETIGLLISRTGLKRFIENTIAKVIEEDPSYYRALTDNSIYGLLQIMSTYGRVSSISPECRELVETALRSLFEYRKPLWKMVYSFTYNKSLAKHMFSRYFGKKFRDILEKTIREELASLLSSKGFSEEDFKLVTLSIDPYPSSAKEIVEYIFLAKTRDDRAVGYELEDIDKFVERHGVVAEALFIIYANRVKYRSLSDEDTNKIIKRVKELVEDAIGGIEEKAPETS